MATARLLSKQESELGHRHQHGALDLARRLPQLVVAAKEVAASVQHGVHGRRQAGVGETFWQFRPFVAGESASRIDWRRSARDERTYVREREWEAAHTVWIWIDRSASMRYVSSLAREPKIDRAIVLGLAAADLLVRGGERVGILGMTRPIAARTIVDRLAQAMLVDPNATIELPPGDPLPARSQAILVGDFLSEASSVTERIRSLSSRGARGHVLMISDPVEETFPFEGHTEFADVDSGERLRVGEARSFRELYVDRLAAHRDAIRRACMSRGWSFALHRTDKPASGALLALRIRIEGGLSLANVAGAN
jgi:uncharacterized protein (DUF58 family)